MGLSSPLLLVYSFTTMNSIPINTVDSPSVILDLIYRMKIKQAMSSRLFTASKNTTLLEIQQMLKREGISGVPVTEDKRLLGLVSMHDIIEALQKGYIDDPAHLHMSRQLKVLEEDMPLSFAISYFDRYSYGRFPVLNKERELVGIITSRDIILTLLVEMNKEVEALEKKQGHISGVSNTSQHLEFATRKHDFENAGKASTEIKKTLKRLDIPPKTTRRIAIATYELEMNQVVHSEGGRILCAIDDKKVIITAIDTGPGIPDVEQALQVGYSTANEWIQSLGFGAGMGLPNIKRVSDEFTIESSAGSSTKAVSIIYLS